MHRALWLLCWLRFVGWVRRIGRRLRTVKGALLTLFVGILLSLWFVLLVATALMQPHGERLGRPELARTYGPMALLAYCVLLLALPSNERMIAFTPAEVNLLFPAPFSRRQLLAYKIVVMALKSIAGTLILAVLFMQYAHHFLAAYIGVMLTGMFVQLVMMTLALVAATVGALAYRRGRRWLLALVVAAVAIAAVFLRGKFQGDRSGWILLIPELSQSPVIWVILAPFRWFVDVFTAERLWPDLVVSSALGLSVDVALVVAIMALDAQYLETAAAASERVYARLEKLRRGGLASQWGSAGRPRFSLPSFPWWGGAGPIAWRQMLAAVRSLKSLVLFLVIVGAIVGWPLLLSRPDQAQRHGASGSSREQRGRNVGFPAAAPSHLRLSRGRRSHRRAEVVADRAFSLGNRSTDYTGPHRERNPGPGSDRY